MDKETIAKALHKHDFPDLRWEREKDFIQEIYNNQAEAVIKALEAEAAPCKDCDGRGRYHYPPEETSESYICKRCNGTGWEQQKADVPKELMVVNEEAQYHGGRVFVPKPPKELMDCLLSEDQCRKSIRKANRRGAIYAPREIAEAQLKAVAPYIEAVKKAGYKQGVDDQHDCQQIDIEEIKKAERERVYTVFVNRMKEVFKDICDEGLTQAIETFIKQEVNK